MKISEIIDYVLTIDNNCKFHVNPDNDIIGCCPIANIKTACVTWVRNLNDSIVERLNEEPSVLAICNIDSYFVSSFNSIYVENPHRTFFKIIERFFYSPTYPDYSKYSLVNAKNIGDGFRVGAFSFIGPDVIIGNNCIVGNNVSIEGSVTIGNDVIIEAGVKIGTWGFGHYLNNDGTSTIIPHLGGVRIGDHVFLGADTVVSRGTLSDTVIGNYVKVDAQCCICHNAIIEDRVLIAGGVGIAGSAQVKKDVWLSPRCVINAGVIVGDSAFVGINSVVTHDVPENKYVFGSPAEIIRDNNDKKYKI